VYVKAGVSQAEPLVAPDSEGQLRLTVDKGNQSTSGSAAAVLGNVAKENDDSDQYAIFHRNNRSIQQSATTSADGSLWIFFGTDSGFESTTALYYTHAAAVLMPKAKPSLNWNAPPAAKNPPLKKRRKSRQGRIPSSVAAVYDRRTSTLPARSAASPAVEALCERLRGAKPVVTDSRYRSRPRDSAPPL